MISICQLFLFVPSWSSASLKPYVTEVSHVGLVVSDADRHVSFYNGVLGFEVLFDRMVDDPQSAKELGLNVTAPILRNIMLQTPTAGFKIQLFQYFKPIGSRIFHQINDYGFYNHLGVGVKNITHVFEVVKEIPGITVIHAPVHVASGWWIFYIVDWDGNYIEIYEPAK